MDSAFADTAIRLMRRAILLTYAGRYSHALGQIHAALGTLVLAYNEIRVSEK